MTKSGWTLSPAYDLNPNQYGVGLKLNISENDNFLDFNLALSVAPYFRLSEKRATELIDQTKKVVSEWRDIATKYKIPKSEQDMMRPAFRNVN